MGSIPPYVLYAEGKDGNLLNASLMLAMLFAASVSFLVFALCRYIFPTSLLLQQVIGWSGSYVSFLLLAILVSAMQGNLPETIMWLPIIVLFGIPFMAPLIGMSWLATHLMFGPKRD